MISSQWVDSYSSHRLATIQSQYRALIGRNSYSLADLFSCEDFSIQRFCSHFSPNANLDVISQEVLEFCTDYSFLLPSTRHYISCALFLFPSSETNPGVDLAKVFAVDFYLNDLIGRESQTVGNPSGNHSALVDTLVGLKHDFSPPRSTTLLVEANFNALHALKCNSEPWGFDRFLSLYCEHMQAAHQTHLIDGGSPGSRVKNYIEQRNTISGMPHTIAYIEYSTGFFFDYPVLCAAGILPDIKKLQQAASLIGCLLNVFFSFEKEVVDAGCFSNLLMVVSLNFPGLSLREIIEAASAIVKAILKDFWELWNNTNTQCLSLRDSAIQIPLQKNLAALQQAVQACWTLQASTKRYKRNVSIWAEATLHES
jgi:hypothetical protein